VAKEISTSGRFSSSETEFVFSGSNRHRLLKSELIIRGVRKNDCSERFRV